MDCADDQGVKQLVEDNIDYAYALAKQFSGEVYTGDIDIEDIRANAILGLCDAARRFDPANGVQFRTFSYFRIRGAMFDLIRRSNQLMKCEREYLQQIANPETNHSRVNSESDSDDNVSTSYAKNNEELNQLKDFVMYFYRKADPGFEGEDVVAESVDHKNAEKKLLWKDTVNYIYNLTQSLPKNERNILQMHYFEGFSFPEIRQIYANVSRSWISRIHIRGIDRLRDLITAGEKRGIEIERI